MMENGMSLSTKNLIKEYPYLYETHLHTSEASACARNSAVDMAKSAKEAGYSGIFITNHNWGGNTCIHLKLPWDAWVHAFCQGYREAKEWGDANDFDVFFGYEAGYNGTEFLIYGVDEEWMVNHPEIREASIQEQFKLVNDAGGMVIHAHPYREEWYIPDIRLFPEYVNGVEAINATHSNPKSTSHNDPMYDINAIEYAKKYDFPATAGSDIHSVDHFGGGVAFRTRLTSVKDYCERILGRQDYLLTNGDKWYDNRCNELV